MTDGHALRVAMVVYDDIALDSRVQREANALAAAGHAVTIFCVRGSRSTAPMLDTTVEIVAVNAGQGLTTNPSPSPFHARTGTLNGPVVIHKTRWLISYARALRAWGRAVTATSTPFDVWHAHDFTGLVAVSSGRTGRAACVYDVHDLFTDTGTGAHLPRPVRIALRRYERRLVKRVDLVVTVNRPLAEVIEAQCEPRTIAVVHNCPPVWVPPGVRPNLIREATGIPGEAPVILYHGALSPDRGVDRLCEALLEPGLETAHLALLGFGAHRGRYVGLAQESPIRGPGSSS